MKYVRQTVDFKNLQELKTWNESVILELQVDDIYS